jgi:hypothetical protein
VLKKNSDGIIVNLVLLRGSTGSMYRLISLQLVVAWPAAHSILQDKVKVRSLFVEASECDLCTPASTFFALYEGQDICITSRWELEGHCNSSGQNLKHINQSTLQKEPLKFISSR